MYCMHSCVIYSYLNYSILCRFYTDSLIPHTVVQKECGCGGGNKGTGTEDIFLVLIDHLQQITI